MARKRRKVHVGRKEEGQEPKIMDADRISNLPDHVILHILSFLPTIDAFCMSLVSRHWRRMWYSVPTLDFRLGGTREWFCNFVEQCLKNRETGNHRFMNSVTTFNLEMYFCGCRSEVDRWLGIAIHPQLQELELIMHDVDIWSVHPREEKYCLPQFVLNATSLTILRLDCVKLEACFSINLPSLKTLSLTYVQVEDELVHNLVLGCPSLENLLVLDCITPSNLRISSSTLKFLQMDGEWDQIHLEAENLEYFDCGVNVRNFDIASSKKLTSLSLTDVYFSSSDSFENLISGFPLLEKLTLYQCKPVDIRHQYLKILVWFKCMVREEDKYEISIDAPNLVSLDYRGEGALIHFFMNCPNLLKANITLDSYRETSSMEWYVDIINFLTFLDCSKSMRLSVHSEEALLFPKKVRNICRSPLPNLKHLKVHTCKALQRKSDLRDALLWLSPSLETLSID